MIVLGWVVGGLCAIGSGFVVLVAAVRLSDDYRYGRRIRDCEQAELRLYRQVAAIAAIEEDLCADPFEELDREWCSTEGMIW